MSPHLQPDRVLRDSQPLPACGLIVTDGRAGARARATGVARALGFELGLAPRASCSTLWSWNVLDPLERFNRSSGTFCGPWPDIAIATGHGTVPYLKTLRRASEGATFTVLLQRPRTRLDVADLIWCPAHDSPQAANVISTPTTPHVMRPGDFLALQRTPAPEIEAMGRPVAAVLLGGPDTTFNFDASTLEHFAESLRRFVGAGISFLITSSQRTNSALLRTATEATRGAKRIVWSGLGANPYWSFLAHADLVIVTGDSLNMTSEACATGKPVYVFEPGGGLDKHTLFHAHLRDYGATRPLTAQVDPCATWSYRPLDSAPYIATEIVRRFRASRDPIALASARARRASRPGA